jgi:hypothetical protein
MHAEQKVCAAAQGKLRGSLLLESSTSKASEQIVHSRSPGLILSDRVDTVAQDDDADEHELEDEGEACALTDADGVRATASGSAGSRLLPVPGLRTISWLKRYVCGGARPLAYRAPPRHNKTHLHLLVCVELHDDHAVSQVDGLHDGGAPQLRRLIESIHLVPN